jgi:hypothetical protein
MFQMVEEGHLVFGGSGIMASGMSRKTILSKNKTNIPKNLNVIMPLPGCH